MLADGRVQVVRSLRAARGIVALSTLRLDQQPGLETAFVIASLRALSEAQLFALAAAQPRELLALAVLEKAKPTKPSPKPPPDCHKKQPQDCYRGPEPLRFTGRGVAVGRFQLNHK